MRAIRLAAAAASVFLSAVAWAQPATVDGHYVNDAGERVALTHVTALRLDGVESGGEPRVRVLLSDRPVPIETLDRVLVPEIVHLGRAGQVRGLLLEFEPSDRSEVSILELDSEEGRLTIADRNPGASVWKTLSGNFEQVSGEFEPRSGADAAFRFGTAVAYDPVQQTLTGRQAQESEFVTRYVRRMEAVAHGDMETVRRLSTRRAAERLQPFPAEFIPEARRMAEAAIRTARERGRVIVRGRTALLDLGGGTAVTFEREDAQWKVGD